MNREELLKDIVEHDTESLFEDGKALYQYVYETLMHNYGSYTDKEIETMHTDIFN